MPPGPKTLGGQGGWAEYRDPENFKAVPWVFCGVKTAPLLLYSRYFSRARRRPPVPTTGTVPAVGFNGNEINSLYSHAAYLYCIIVPCACVSALLKPNDQMPPILPF
jgi:hypothetical protein